MSESGRPKRGRAPAGDEGHGRHGFSLVELVVAVMILAIGVMGMAATTGYVVRATSFAEVRTQRTLAVQSVLESIRADDFDDVSSGADTIGLFELQWTSESLSPTAKRVYIVSRGPGLASGNLGRGMPAIEEQVVDTMTYVLLKP